ncbi:MAG TPA: hypothetical protein VI874_00980 [Candidatus Norongarragalinales archaeon]|nr:hypothetical protein [Candidatus Norongarragalinales archaeon]
MGLKGFAFLAVFPWSSALLVLIASTCAQSVDASFWEDKFSTLLYRQAVGWDVRHAFQSVGAPVSGKEAEWSVKLAAYSLYLETQYPVSARLWRGDLFGSGTLRSMFENNQAMLCTSCSNAFEEATGIFGVSLFGGDWAAIEVLA